MPDTPPDGPGDADERLGRILAELIAAREADPDLDLEPAIAAHPEFGDRLRDFLDADRSFHRRVRTILSLREGGVFADFELLREIRRRSTGEVWEARRGGKRVALKILTASDELNNREAWALRTVSHPNIVPLVESGRDNGVPYLAMPFIQGVTLSDVFTRLSKSTAASFPVERPDLPGVFESLQGNDVATRCRAVAALGMQVAEALAHVHERGLLHRDVKPGNLMLDDAGRVFLTDFGIARSADLSDQTRTESIVGTPGYMSPERHRGDYDERDDIYALGITLYELTTLREAFPRPLDFATRPTSPRRVDRGIPREFETILETASGPGLDARYRSARALAEDLGRFLRGERVKARRPGALCRAWRGCRRDPARAAAVLLVAASIGVGVGLGWSWRRETRYAAKLDEIDRILAGPRWEGWRSSIRELVRSAERYGADSRLADRVTTSLHGFDAREVEGFAGIEGSTLVFSRDGERLLIGGTQPTAAGKGFAHVRDRRGRLVGRPSRHAGPGPVAFAADGRALQLIDQGDRGFLLHDITNGVDLAHEPIPGDPRHRISALSGEGLRFAVAEGAKLWRRDVTGSSTTTPITLPRPITSLAISPDGTRIAAGDERGGVSILTFVGSTPLVVIPTTKGNKLLHLRFARDPVRDGDSPPGWLVAAGDIGGDIAIIDIAGGSVRRTLPGGGYAIDALAVSEDAMLLASASRNACRVIDLAGGDELLQVRGDGAVSNLALSPNDHRLARSGDGISPTAVRVATLENGRGVATLRGLTAPAGLVVVSPYGRRAAALSHDWRLGVWDLDSFRLIGVFQGPVGYYADNYGFAFSPDGKRIVLSAGTEAQLWDVDRGRRLRTWSDLDPGLVDRVAYPDPEQIILLRHERADGKGTPADDDWSVSPRVLRVRNLALPGETWRKPLVENREFARVNDARLTPDGSVALIHAILPTPGPKLLMSVRALDVATGRGRWEKRFHATQAAGHINLNADGTVAVYHDVSPRSEPRSSWLESKTGRSIPMPRNLDILADVDLRHFVGVESEFDPITSLTRVVGIRVTVRSGTTDMRLMGLHPAAFFSFAFRRDGRKLVAGLRSGAVVATDLGKCGDARKALFGEE